MNSAAQEPFSLVIISAGTSDPSSTRMLADRIAEIGPHAAMEELAHA